MLRKPVHYIFYLSTLQKPAAGIGFCNVLKYKADDDTETGLSLVMNRRLSICLFYVGGRHLKSTFEMLYQLSQC